jgi:hypothetical protein
MRPASTIVRPARLALAAALCAFSAAPALGQSVSGGDRGVKGQLVSRSVTAPALGSAPVYLTEPKGFFVLTQVCTANADAGDEAVVSGTTVGLLATDRQTCRSYEPGFVVPAGETLTCVNTLNDFPLVCTITGIQTAGK